MHLKSRRGNSRAEVSESRSVVSDSLRPHGLFTPWNSPGQNTGVGSLCLLQGIVPTQGANPGLALQADFLPAESQERKDKVLSACGTQTF